MSHTLISFLGRVPKSESGYRTTRYRFPDGAHTRETAFIGWSLRERINADRLVILGTSGSMWDYLVESIPIPSNAGEDDRLELQSATEEKSVNQSLLDRVAPLVGETLGCDIKLVIIPYSESLDEQLDLLQIMATYVDANEQVSMDVTHGFRHLPMLALLSALHLRIARQAQIEGIYYGAFDPDTGDAPVYDLSGLLRIADWVGALHTFDKDGDYGVFGELLEKDNLPDTQANHLRRAAFLERTSNAWNARDNLLNFEKVLSTGLPGVSGLFTEQLQKRIRWHKSSALFAQQRDLARQYLERGDYIRTGIFAYESFVTQLIDPLQNEEESNFKHRNEAYLDYEKGKRGKQSLRKDYFLLKHLRNTLAHGDRSQDDKVGSIISDEERLAKELRRLIKKLLF